MNHWEIDMEIYLELKINLEIKFAINLVMENKSLENLFEIDLVFEK